VLRQEPTLDTYKKLDTCYRHDRLSNEQLEVANRAINYLLTVPDDAILQNIYHVLWNYAFLEEQKCRFRGQRDCR
jgi:hypothetical protein